MKYFKLLSLVLFSLLACFCRADDADKTNPQTHRSTDNDCVFIKKIGAVHGQILNKQYTLLTRFGKIEFPASSVISAEFSRNSAIKLNLADGQIYSGTILDEKISLRMTIDELTEAKFSEIDAFSYAISSEKPVKIPCPAPSLLVGGSVIKLVPGKDFKIDFQCIHGKIKVPLDKIISLERQKTANIWKLKLSNNSEVTGSVILSKFKAELKPLPAQSLFVTLEESILNGLFGTSKAEPVSGFAKVSTISGDVILGRPINSKIEIMTATGPVELLLIDIISIKFDHIDTNKLTLQLWGNREIAGRIIDKVFPVDIQPCGIKINLRTDQLLSIDLSNTLLPEQFARRIRQAAENLNSSDINKAMAADKTLRLLGKPAEKILKKIILESDPAISARLREIIKSYKAPFE